MAMPSVERRLAPRRRVLKAGRILIDQKSVISCKVRNLSASGARLEFPSVLGVPASFVLDIASERRDSVRVVWKTGTDVGVTFLPEAPAAH